jgi:hypothetical protein
MTPNEQDEFSGLVSAAMAYFGATASPYVLSVWWAACEPYTMEQVRQALTRHAKNPDTGRFAPKVADIVRLLEGTTEDKAALAWGKALDAAQRVGAYSDVVFDDPSIHAAIEDMGGWPKFCRVETKDLSYLQHRFCESYRAYAARGKFEYPRKLGGDRSSDDVYRMRGLEPPKPHVVGDKAEARLVYKGGSAGGRTVTIADMGRIVAERIGGAAGEKSAPQGAIRP